MTIVEKPTRLDTTELKATMSHLLKCSEDQYAEYQYRNGLAYLYWYLPCDPYGRDQLERSKLYWSWFRKMFAEYDASFIASPGIEKETLKERRRLWRALHDPQTLAIEVKPNKVVLSEIKKRNPHANTKVRAFS